MQDLDTKIELATGGLGTSCNVIVNPNNLEHVEESLLLTSYCLDTNLERMMELWAAIFEDLHLNNIDREEGDTASDFSLFITDYEARYLLLPCNIIRRQTKMAEDYSDSRHDF